MAPLVNALERDGYNVQQIDIDQNPQLAAQFAVDAVPCFVVVERGKEIDRIVGQTSIDRLKLKLWKNSAVGSQHNSPRLAAASSRSGQWAAKKEKSSAFRLPPSAFRLPPSAFPLPPVPVPNGGRILRGAAKNL